MAKFIRFPFGVSGDRDAIPDEVDPSGAVSYAEGFGPDYEITPGDPDWRAVPRPGTNQIYYDMTDNIRQYQLYGVPEWYAPADNGGVAISYPIASRVRHLDIVYVSLVATNTVEPGTDATKWAVDEACTFATLAEMRAGTSLQKVGAVARVAAVAQSGYWNYAVAGGAADALTAALVPAPAALANGLRVDLLVLSTNTNSGSTFNLNGLGEAPIVRSDGTAVHAGDLVAGKISSLVYLAGSWYLPTLPVKSASNFRAQQSNQLIPTDVDTVISTWPSVVSTLVDSVFSAGVLTVGAKDAGLWQLNANVNYALQTGMSVNIQKNAVSVCGTSISANATSLVAATMIQLDEGDAVRVLTSQLSGAGALLSGSQGVSFSGFRISK